MLQQWAHTENNISLVWYPHHYSSRGWTRTRWTVSLFTSKFRDKVLSLSFSGSICTVRLFTKFIGKSSIWTTGGIWSFFAAITVTTKILLCCHCEYHYFIRLMALRQGLTVFFVTFSWQSCNFATAFSQICLIGLLPWHLGVNELVTKLEHCVLTGVWVHCQYIVRNFARRFFLICKFSDTILWHA